MGGGGCLGPTVLAFFPAGLLTSSSSDESKSTSMDELESRLVFGSEPTTGICDPRTCDCESQSGEGERFLAVFCAEAPGGRAVNVAGEY